MAESDDWRERVHDESRHRDRAAVVQRTRDRVSVPATLLILFGLVGGTIDAAWLTQAVLNPTVLADWLRGLAEAQPPGPQRDDALKGLSESEADFRLDTPVNLAGGVTGVVLGVVMVVGGVAMKRLSSYGLAMTAAVAGLIPLGGCCCLSSPFGLWAVLVLTDRGVRAGFAARAGRAVG